MTIDGKTKDEKLQCNINRENAKISALSLGKIDKFEYLTGKEILTSDQSRITDQAKFSFSPLDKTFKKQIKTIKDQGIKQVEVLKALKPEENKEDIKSIEGVFPKDMRNNEIKNEIYQIKKWEKKIKREDLKYKTKNHTHGFQQYETIRSFGESIYTGKINIDEAEMDQRNLLRNLGDFNNKSRPRRIEGKD